jgi:hypothetical protein
MPKQVKKTLAESGMRNRSNSPRSGGGRAGARDKMTTSSKTPAMNGRPVYAKKNMTSGSSNPSTLMRRVMDGKGASQKVSGKFPRKGY